MVSGPDFEVTRRWRRTFEDSPYVTVRDFVSSFVRRVEAPCRADWTAVSIFRAVCFAYTAEHTMSIAAPFHGKRGGAAEHSAQEYIQMASNLFYQLHHGFTGTGIHRMPIAGDTTKLEG